MTMPRHRRASYAQAHGPCLICQRPYERSAARPRWAFYQDGRYAGTVHTACADRRGREAELWTVAGEEPLEIAWFVVWRDCVNQPPPKPRRGEPPSAEYEAWTFATDPHVPTISTGHPEADEAYQRLRTAYWEWRKGLLSENPDSTR